MCPSVIFKVLTPESEGKPWRSIKPGYSWLLNSILQSLLIDNLRQTCHKCTVTNHFGAAGKCIWMAPQEQVQYIYQPGLNDPQQTHVRPMRDLGGNSSPFKFTGIGESINALHSRCKLKMTNTMDKKH